MKNCVECGKELGDDAKFCGGCGAKQPEKLKAVEPKKAKAEKQPAPKKTVAKAPPKPVKSEKKKSNFHEKKMAIFELTNKDNCKECGYGSCMSFAMKAASPKSGVDLDECPYIDEDDAEELMREFDDDDDDDSGDRNGGGREPSGNQNPLRGLWWLGGRR